MCMYFGGMYQGVLSTAGRDYEKLTNTYNDSSLMLGAFLDVLTSMQTYRVRHQNLKIYATFDVGSEFEVENTQFLCPEAKIAKKHNLSKFLIKS